jgi:RNA 2',3'-cyclic 3'-phosphodiesterase
MPRLFIALPLNENTSNENTKDLYNYLNRYDKELKVVSPENYHITLKFIGNCSDKIANKIEENFNHIAGSTKVIPFTIFGLGVFPELKNANVIWAGIKTDETVINKLHQSVENFASDFGIKKEKNKFTPHLTLARLRKGKKLNENVRQYLVENKELFLYESFFKKIVLVSSELTSEGPIYTEVKSIQLNSASNENE